MNRELTADLPPTLAPIAGAIQAGSWAIHTPRLDLIPLDRTHAAEMFVVLGDPELYHFTGGRAPRSLAWLTRDYALGETRLSPGGVELWLNWIVREREPAASIGYVQASVVATHADLAWVIGSEWQRRGIATEAARAMAEWLADLGVRRFRACIRPDHLASQRVAARLGMERTADQVDGEDVWVTVQP